MNAAAVSSCETQRKTPSRTDKTHDDAITLLSAALDPSGFICIAGIEAGRKTIHKFFAPGQYEEAVNQAFAFDSQGIGSFWATSSFLSSRSRKADNVHAVRLFKLDLDVAAGDEKKYNSKRDAIAALNAFIETVGLPVPTLVDSGGGAHAYWLLSHAMDREEAQIASTKLKALCATNGLKADPTVTSDLARVMRLPGTSNRKYGVAKPVILKTPVVQHDTDRILQIIDEACDDKCSGAVISNVSPLFGGSFTIPRHLRGLESDATTKALAQGVAKSFADLLKRSIEGTGCAQIAYAHDHQATLNEPRWRAAGLSIAQFCNDGPEFIHTMSREHPGYTAEATIAKAAQIPGPWTCGAFESTWPEECNGCKHKGRIASPIALAIPLEKADSAPLHDAIATVRIAVKRARDGDVGAPLEPDTVAAMRIVKAMSAAEFQRLRADLKKAHSGVSLAAIDDATRDESRGERGGASDVIVRFARDNCVLFHDPDCQPYATFDRGGHRECWNLNSTGFREWLSHQIYQEHGFAPSETAMTTALSNLAGQAKFDGEERPVAVRVAKHNDDYYIDLCDDQWRAIRVRGDGWQIIQAPPVMFLRTASMRPLPAPVHGGSIAALWEYANVEPDDRPLLLAWLVEALRPDTPYPILELVAEQGAAKSFTQSILRELTDPNKANLRAKPKSIDDLFVSAKVSHMTSLENLSYLSADFQDALCSLATGAGYGGRTLYTNGEETVFEVKRPVMLNGIAIVATAQDLLDRTLLIDCPVITVRRTESDLNEKFADAKHKLFGALLTLFANALKELPSVEICPSELPRMADFGFLGEAVFRVLGRPNGEFLSSYQAKRRHAILQTIEASPVASALRAWLDINPAGYSGTLKALDALLARHRPMAESWPKSMKSLGDALRRITPAMRMLGFDIRPGGRHRDGYHLDIKPMCVPSRESS
jgi:hypothetical protein